MTATNDIRQTFFQECDELLEALNDGLSEIDDGIEDSSFDLETVNAVFRSVHSIKGGGAAFGLDALVRFSHQFETTLDEMRSGRLVPTIDVMKLCHRAADHLSDLVGAAQEEAEVDETAGADLIARMAALGAPPGTAPGDDSAATEPELSFEPLGLPIDLAFDPAPIGSRTIKVEFSATRQLYANGNDPTYLFRELSDLGHIIVQLDDTDLPSLEDLVWDESYLDWTLTLETEKSLTEVREVFDFVEGLCRLDISEVDDFSNQVAQTQPIGVPDAPLRETAASPTEDTVPSQSYGSSTITADQPKKTGGGSSKKSSVRVDLDLVDRLINIVGELVINQSVLAQCVDDAGLTERTELATSLNEFKNLARDIQEAVMSIRAQSVKPLFQRMARIVREASDIAGKTVRLETIGEATEVDKTVIERLVDPLTHMIRNSVDHGLEGADTRRAAGKPETGCITLSAAHRSGRVIIEISDDGAGINRPKVLEIAKSKGLVPRDAVLTDAEINKLLFLPGFSTAREVTDLSGRGVGMDVVRSAIQKLGGRVNVMSSPGKGTTMSISLPLTLAVLDGMVVDVCGQTMVVPITAIIETLRPTKEDIHALGGQNLVVSVREKFVPIIDLGTIFGHRNEPGKVTDMVLLLIESDQQQNWALAVDRIYDQRQVVIKGLEGNYGRVPGVAAATILGDGKIALIIDPEETAEGARPVVPSSTMLDEV